MNGKTVDDLLALVGLPARDAYDLPSSPLRFPDGAHYRIEISGVERVSTLEALVDEMEKRRVPIHRLICTVMGATLLDRKELKDFAILAASKRLEVIITPGPRPQWDLGKQIATPEGAVSGLRIRGMDNVRALLHDILRLIELGFRGFLVWDEGVLDLLNNLRSRGDIPAETVFKVSIFAGHANPAGARLCERLGADTLNPVVDLTPPMLAAIRKTISMPMDLHVYLCESFGGQNRFWESAELARVAAPCYFKIEPGTSVSALYKPWISEDMLASFVREKVKYAEIIRELITRIDPYMICSERGPEDLAVPKP